MLPQLLILYSLKEQLSPQLLILYSLKEQLLPQLLSFMSDVPGRFSEARNHGGGLGGEAPPAKGGNIYIYIYIYAHKSE